MSVVDEYISSLPSTESEQEEKSVVDLYLEQNPRQPNIFERGRETGQEAGERAARDLQEVGRTVLSNIPFLRLLSGQERQRLLNKDYIKEHPVLASLDYSMEPLGLLGGAGMFFKGGAQKIAPKIASKLALQKPPPIPPHAKKPGFLKTAEDLLSEQKGKGALTEPQMPGMEQARGANFLDIQSQKQVGTDAIGYGKQKPGSALVAEQHKRINVRLAEEIAEGNFTSDNIRYIQSKYGYSPEQLAQAVMNEATYSARTMANLSHIARELNATFKGNEAVQGALGKFADVKQPIYSKVIDVYRSIDNPRRMAMVTQPATAARNAISQGGRYTLSVFDDAMKGMIQFSGDMPAKEAFADFMGRFHGLWSRVPGTKAKKQVESILKKYPVEEAKMLSAPVHDITMGGKISNFMMSLNRWQEYFFRKMAFDAKISSWAKKNGVDLAKSKDIPQEVLSEAVDHALDVTFASMPKSAAGKAIMNVYKDIPFFTTVNPYPRFWLNAVKFLWDFNPTGFITAASRSKLLSKNPQVAWSEFNKATMGTLMLGAAIEFRKSGYAGEKWYEIKTGNKTEDGNDEYIDTRAFAPFSSYLFAAELMLHPENINRKDFMQGMVGINRIAGTGLVLLDWMFKDQKPDTVWRKAKEFAGNFLGGFTVPAQAGKDIMAATGAPEEGVVRDTDENFFSGPILSKLPYVSTKMFAEAPRITRAEPYRRLKAGIRQLTGLTYKDKNVLEQEIDKLNIKPYRYSGDRKLDRHIKYHVGQLVGNGLVGEDGKNIIQPGTEFVQTDAFQNTDRQGKIFLLRKYYNDVYRLVKDNYLINYLKEELPQKSSSERYNYVDKMVERGYLGRKYLSFLEKQEPEFIDSMFTKKQWAKINRLSFLK